MARRKSKKNKSTRGRQRKNLANRNRLLAHSTLWDITPLYYRKSVDKTLHPAKRMERIKIWQSKPIINNARNIRKDNKFRRITYAEMHNKSDRNNIYRDKVCKSRAQRREIMHALRKTGKGGSGKAKKRYTDKSQIKC